MKSHAIATVILLAFAAYASAQATRPASTQPATQPAGYWVRVTVDRLNVRNRPDANSRIVTRVEKNTVLRAVEEQYGWHKIVPPRDAFSLVAARYIQRTGDTGTVQLNSGTLRVRVGSTEYKIDPLTSDVQTRLDNGTRVRILGEQDDWLKIVPPDDVYVYVTAKYAQRISDAVADSLRAAQNVTTRPSQTAGIEPPPVPPDSQPTLSSAWGEKLTAIEEAIFAERTKPAEAQDWAGLVERLGPIAEQREDHTAARLAKAWMASLRQRVAAQEAAAKAAEILRQQERQQAQHDAEMRRIRRLQKRATTRPAYTAKGIFLRSLAMHERDDRQWFKLMDPVTQKVAVYLEISGDAELNLDRLLNKYVAVNGDRRPDERLGADIVRVSRIVILRDQPTAAPATQPARD
jgi:hypothetical protein